MNPEETNYKRLKMITRSYEVAKEKFPESDVSLIVTMTKNWSHKIYITVDQKELNYTCLI